MKKLLIVLLLFACSEEEEQLLTTKDLVEDCLSQNHDLSFKNECRCLYAMTQEKDSIIYQSMGTYTLYDYLLYQDSIDCGIVRPPGILSIIKEDVVLGGIELKCDC